MATPPCQDPLGTASFVSVPKAPVEWPGPPSFEREAFGCRKLCLVSAEVRFLTHVHPSFLKDRELVTPGFLDKVKVGTMSHSRGGLGGGGFALSP